MRRSLPFTIYLNSTSAIHIWRSADTILCPRNKKFWGTLCWLSAHTFVFMERHVKYKHMAMALTSNLGCARLSANIAIFIMLYYFILLFFFLKIANLSAREHNGHSSFVKPHTISLHNNTANIHSASDVVFRFSHAQLIMSPNIWLRECMANFPLDAKWIVYTIIWGSTNERIEKLWIWHICMRARCVHNMRWHAISTEKKTNGKKIKHFKEVPGANSTV